MLKRPETSGDGGYTYHYDRSERLQKNPRVRKAFYDSEDCKSFLCIFKRNRGLLFLLIDVLILALLFWIYQSFLVPSSTLTKDGVTFTLQAFRVEKGVLVSFRLQSKNAIPSKRVPLLFQIGTQEWPSEIEVGAEKVIRQFFPEEKVREVKATLEWAGKSYTLQTSIQRE
ncbi:MAG: hypothetical protein SNJ78_00575 [Spirochaetales bacterium]